MKKKLLSVNPMTIALMFVVSLTLFTIIQLPEASDNIYALEISGSLTDGGENIDIDQKYFASGVNDSYDRLRSWGISRAKNGGLPKADPGTPELLAKYASLYLADTEKKVVYLTFDEGYENGYTGTIMDILFAHKVNAIFFITGPYLEKEEILVRRMLDEGHAVGNHSIHHKSLPLLSDKELEEEIVGLDRRFYDKFEKNMLFLRPPKGEYSERTLDITSKLGYINMFWSFAYDDWNVNNQRGWEYAFEKVKNNLHNGEILLLHAVSKDNAEALDAIIQYVRDSGFEFGNVFELEKLSRGGGL